MNTLIMVGQLIFGLSILVLLHELGHFLAARAFGIRVEKFYLFFDAWGFKLFKIKIKDTEYGIGWLPLGGYVKISGMIDESMDKEQLKQPAQPWEFRSKPSWQRLIVMVAGVAMNLILGIAIFWMFLFNYTKEYLPNDYVKEGIYAYEIGRSIGFKTGDKIVSVNGEKIERFNDVISIDVMFGSTIAVEREGKIVKINIPENFYKKFIKSKKQLLIDATNFPYYVDSVLPENGAFKAGLQKGDVVIGVNNTQISSFGSLSENLYALKDTIATLTIKRNNEILIKQVEIDSFGKIGIAINKYYDYKSYSFTSSLVYGTKDAFNALVVNAKGLWLIVTGKENASDSVQGPIGISKIYGSVWIWEKFWYITGLLSMVLAFMNILPIPALDGGHVIFLLIEMVIRRPLPEKVMEKIQMVGMVILFGLMAFAIGNDIWKLFVK